MAINQNHPFEELNGVKCGIAERNASSARVAFLKTLLEHNGYEVVVVPSPAPKAAVPPKPAGVATSAAAGVAAAGAVGAAERVTGTGAAGTSPGATGSAATGVAGTGAAVASPGATGSEEEGVAGTGATGAEQKIPGTGNPQEAVSTEQVSAPETFTVGVTDYTFNSTNAIFGRLLRTPEGHVVTRDYWLQKSSVAMDDIPYYETQG